MTAEDYTNPEENFLHKMFFASAYGKIPGEASGRLFSKSRQYKPFFTFCIKISFGVKSNK
jgi:hypothetical protein